MKIIFKYLCLPALLLLILAGCDKPITDFGYNGTITGTMKDANGNIVPGDITLSSFIVRVQAEGDISTIDMRVKGDGTFGNTKLFPSKSKVWISGPVVPASTDTVLLDLTGNQTIVHDFVVTPVFSVALPVVSGTPAATTANINYNIVANSAKTPSKRELYCSTIPYPNTSTGSGAFYSTVKVTLTANSGTASVTGLVAGTKYYVRIGVQSSTTAMNFSEQITFTTAASK
jgi:hypothetical protein